MLVLSRKPTESILINGNIRITITAIKGGQVRIGIEAPSEVTIDRAEVHQRREEFADRGADRFIDVTRAATAGRAATPRRPAADRTARSARRRAPGSP